MTVGKNTNHFGHVSGIITLSHAEWERFKARKPVIKETGDAHGDYEIVLKMTRKRRKPGSTYETTNE